MKRRPKTKKTRGSIKEDKFAEKWNTIDGKKKKELFYGFCRRKKKNQNFQSSEKKTFKEGFLFLGSVQPF